MKKNLLPLIMICFICAQASAQRRITFGEPVQSDVWPVLEMLGVDVFNLILPVDTTEAYDLTLILEEFEDGQLKSTHNFPIGPTTKRTIWQGETDVSISSYDRITLFFNAIDKENVKFGYIVDVRGSGQKRLETKTGNHFYVARPFKKQEFGAAEKKPVLMYGSSWLDERINMHRFCGSNEIDTDMTDELFELSPHYFIISIRLNPNDGAVKDLNRRSE